MFKSNHQQGLTLIELIIAIAVIAILTAVAIPAYHDYNMHTKAGEGFDLAEAAKKAVEKIYTSTKAWPVDNTAAGLPEAKTITGQYVSSVTVGAYGVVTVTFGAIEAKLSRKSLVFTPYSKEGSIQWNCHSTNIAIKYRPNTCRAMVTERR